MPALRYFDSWKLYSKNISYWLEISTYLLCFVTLIIALFDNDLSMKLYTAAAILGVMALISRGKPENFLLQNLLLPLAILAIGIIDIIWYSTFKTDNSLFRSTYHSYLNTAKIFILATVLTYLALSSKIRFKKELPLYILYSVSFIIAGYAHYIKHSSSMARLDFGIGTATGAAYSIMFVGIVSGISILYTQRKHPVLFLLNAAAIVYALGLTQTRSSLLIFPVICTLALVAGYIKSPKKLFYSVIGFLGLLAILISFLSKPMTERYYQGVRDLNSYNAGNSNNSLGARLAMYEVGLDIFLEAPLSARSAEQRVESIKELATQQTYLKGALRYANVHLHNEFIEAASLKGIAGILSTLFFYAALFFTVYHHRSLGLFAITLAIIGTGLSDVILWSRSIPIVLITAIVLMIFVKKNRTGDLVQ